MVYHGSPFLAQQVWTGALRTLIKAGVSKSPRGIHKLLSYWRANKKFRGEGFCDMCRQNLFLGHLLTPTETFGCSKCAPLYAPFDGPTVSVACKYGIFAKPRPLALTSTFLEVFCSHHA